jgi:hypothetical protein
LGSDNPMLGQMAAQRIHQLGSPPHEQIAQPERSWIGLAAASSVQRKSLT